MVRKTRLIKLLLLCFVFSSALFYFFTSDNEKNNLFDGHGNSQIISQFFADWDVFCMSSQFEIPQYDIGKNYNVDCWNRTEEVPAKTIYISFIKEGDFCKKIIISGFFLSKRNSETRCFDKDFAQRHFLSKKSNIVNLVRK